MFAHALSQDFLFDGPGPKFRRRYSARRRQSLLKIATTTAGWRWMSGRAGRGACDPGGRFGVWGLGVAVGGDAGLWCCRSDGPLLLSYFGFGIRPRSVPQAQISLRSRSPESSKFDFPRELADGVPPHGRSGRRGTCRLPLCPAVSARSDNVANSNIACSCSQNNIVVFLRGRQPLSSPCGS